MLRSYKDYRPSRRNQPRGEKKLLFCDVPGRWFAFWSGRWERGPTQVCGVDPLLSTISTQVQPHCQNTASQDTVSARDQSKAMDDHQRVGVHDRDGAWPRVSSSGALHREGILSRPHPRQGISTQRSNSETKFSSPHLTSTAPQPTQYTSSTGIVN